MKHRNFVAILLLGAVLSLSAWPPAAGETGNETVLLKLHVPSTAG